MACSRSPGTRFGATLLAAAPLVACATPPGAEGFTPWSVTEVHLQVGKLHTPDFAGGGRETTTVVTLDHASAWELGQHYLFVDFLDGGSTAFNDKDIYAEWYPTLSLGAVSGADLSAGALRDVALIGGVNMGADANVLKFLPGVRLAFDVPPFVFLNVDVMAYLDASGGVASGGAPKLEDTWEADLNWSLPFSLGRSSWSLQGHVEWIGAADDELGGRSARQLLAQPQLRYDLGEALWSRPGRTFVGIEWQLWWNKLGEESTDESAVQALWVWRL